MVFLVTTQRRPRRPHLYINTEPSVCCDQESHISHISRNDIFGECCPPSPEPFCKVADICHSLAVKNITIWLSCTKGKNKCFQKTQIRSKKKLGIDESYSLAQFNFFILFTIWSYFDKTIKCDLNFYDIFLRFSFQLEQVHDVLDILFNVFPSLSLGQPSVTVWWKRQRTHNNTATHN